MAEVLLKVGPTSKLDQNPKLNHVPLNLAQPWMEIPLPNQTSSYLREFFLWKIVSGASHLTEIHFLKKSGSVFFTTSHYVFKTKT